MVVKKIVYSFWIPGVMVIFWLYLGGYISQGLMSRALSIYVILLSIYVLISSFIKKVILKLIFATLLIVINIFYARFFFVSDLYILLVPENFTGDISISMNVDSSKNEIRPLNGVVTFELLNTHSIQTHSNFDVKFTRITVAKGYKDAPIPQRGLQFINGRSVVSNGINVITGTIVKRKDE